MKGGLVHETNPGTSTVCGSSYVEKSILEEGERFAWSIRYNHPS